MPPRRRCRGQRPHLASTAGPESAEGILDRRAVQQWIIKAHATFNSCADTYTPRRRNAAGACTTASTRAARVLKGNQNRRSHRASTHGGAPRPSSAAKCSANAARNTSQCSSPVAVGSCSSKPARISAGSHRYSSRNSATSRHRRVSSDPTSKAPRRATVSGSYLAARSLIPPTLVHATPDAWRATVRVALPRRASRGGQLVRTKDQQGGADGTRTRDRWIMSPLL